MSLSRFLKPGPHVISVDQAPIARGGRSPDDGDRGRLDYIADLSRQLATMAREADCQVLAQLLSDAAHEARGQAAARNP